MAAGRPVRWVHVRPGSMPSSSGCSGAAGKSAGRASASGDPQEIRLGRHQILKHCIG